MKALAGWLVDRLARRLAEGKSPVRKGLNDLLLRLYIVYVVWRGIEHAQRAGIDVVGLALTHTQMTVWDREQPTGPGIEIVRLED